MSVMASEITSLAIVYLTVYSGADQRKHQSSASLTSVRGIHRWPVNSPHKKASNAENVSIWWRYHDNSNVVEISFGSHPYSNELITTNFGAWRSSSRSRFKSHRVNARGEVEHWEFPAMLPMTLNWFLWNVFFWYSIWHCNRNSD